MSHADVVEAILSALALVLGIALILAAGALGQLVVG